MVVDESTVSSTQFLNILVGTLDMPHSISYLYDCKPLPCLQNSNDIVQAIDNAVISLGTNRNFSCLLLSDAARYTMAAGTILKSLYPKLFHVICVAHLLHYCAMKVKFYFHDVDQLTAKIKAAIVKNKTRQAQFAAIGYPPKPVVMRWESWLFDALFYANNLPEVKAIVESFGKSGMLVIQANSSLERPRLATQLFKIRDQYECLVKLIKK